MSDIFTGSYLCGAVTYEATSAPVLTGHCHCEDCRRMSATGHASHLAMPRDAVTTSGTVATYDKAADSGNMVTRSFCPTCGCQMWSENSAMPHMVFLHANSLDDPEVFQPMFVVYTKRAASWDRIEGEGLKTYDGMPEKMPV